MVVISITLLLVVVSLATRYSSRFFYTLDSCFHDFTFSLLPGDLVDFIRAGLSESHKEYTRAKIIKQIAYLGVNYEGKRPKG